MYDASAHKLVYTLMVSCGELIHTKQLIVHRYQFIEKSEN